MGRRQVEHRGIIVLVLGILSVVSCPFLGPVAWIMGNNDLEKMRAGRMKVDGRDMTQAGRLCGIVATLLLVAGVLLFVAFIFWGIAGETTTTVDFGGC